MAADQRDVLFASTAVVSFDGDDVVHRFDVSGQLAWNGQDQIVNYEVVAGAGGDGGAAGQVVTGSLNLTSTVNGCVVKVGTGGRTGRAGSDSFVSFPTSPEIRAVGGTVGAGGADGADGYVEFRYPQGVLR